ncbi:MAG: MFS transporter [Gammaproteobacteria bacterium]|nr:MFS transporter [Gammaproteobacteria bacterium]
MPATNTATLGFALRSSWALLLGFGILMLGDGLQGTLLAVRADQEGYSATITGVIMSSFYLGFLCGSIMTPRLMVQVGHIRVFAALAALASAAILVHAVFVHVPVWVLLRLISGFCFSGLYVVAESWLNDRATNETRGQLLSLYMVVAYVGVGLGQLFLNLADPGGYPLFILTSVLVSIAVIPLLLSAGSAPSFEESVNIGFRDLYRMSPLGIVGMFVIGLVTATFFALGPVYGRRLGLNLEEISFFMSAAVVGTVILQWPIGALSDRYDRRLILTIVTSLTAAAAFACVFLSAASTSVLLLSVGLFGGLAFPLYSVCIAYTNDHLQPDQMIAASGTLVMVGGLGAVLGPILVASIMDLFENNGFFWAMGGAHFLTGLFALYRMTRRAPMPLEQQVETTPTTIHPSSWVIESTHQHAKDEALHDDAENFSKPEDS